MTQALVVRDEKGKFASPYEGDDFQALAVSCFLVTGSETKSIHLLEMMGFEQVPDPKQIGRWFAKGVKPSDEGIALARRFQELKEQDKRDETASKMEAVFDKIQNKLLAKLDDPEKEKLWNLTGLYKIAAETLTAARGRKDAPQQVFNMPGATFKVSGATRDDWGAVEGTVIGVSEPAD